MENKPSAQWPLAPYDFVIRGRKGRSISRSQSRFGAWTLRGKSVGLRNQYVHVERKISPTAIINQICHTPPAAQLMHDVKSTLSDSQPGWCIMHIPRLITRFPPRTFLQVAARAAQGGG